MGDWWDNSKIKVNVNFWVTIKNTYWKEVKKKILNAKLEHHMAGPNALLHEVSAYIYIYWLQVFVLLESSTILLFEEKFYLLDKV